MAYISGAVEGPSDEVVLRRIVGHCGATVHRVQVQGGKADFVPASPDDLDDAKVALVTAVGHSTRRAILADMLPRPRSGRRVGPAYTSRLIEFASNEEEGWRPEAAAERSASLARCLARVRELIAIAP